MNTYFNTKLLIRFIAIIAVGAAIYFGISYYYYRQSPEYIAMQYYNEMKAKYEGDTYGGSTPEETLQLFIDALKKGDVELASKYFFVEDQEEEKKYLIEVQQEKLLENMIEELKRAEFSQEGDIAFFTLIEDHKARSQLVMKLYTAKSIWKISEL